MPQRIDAAPVVAAVGAVVLFLSLFLSWYEPDVSGWQVFETLDLLLGLLAIAAGLLAAGQLGAGFAAGIDARLLPVLGAIAVFAVAVTLLQGPPGTEGSDPAAGEWVALAGGLLILAGGTLSAARISVTVTVAGRDGRPRVAAVDRRHTGDEATDDEIDRTESLDAVGDEPPPPA
jgi:hypothetical protein